jgi:hypothetical protein
VELVFLTDNQKPRWQQREIQSFLKELPNSVRVKVVETGSGSSHNAWIANVQLFQFGDDEDRWVRAEVGCNSESNVARSIRLTGITGVADDAQPVALKPGQLARVDFRIPAGLNLQGQVAELRLEPTDALASDDVYYLNLDTTWALRVLLVEPEALGPDGRRVGLFLQTGMKALAGAKNQSLDVMSRTSASVTASDVQKADLILLAGVPELADGVLESLELRVRSGAGLALYLGPQLKPGFANQKLYRSQQPAEGLLPLSWKNGEGSRAVLTSVRWTHPLLASLQDPILSDFAQSGFRTYANLAGIPGKNDVVLARFDDDVPAILEHPLGAGRVLVFNTSANDDWTDLPKRKSFLPLLDRTLSYLSSGGVKRSFVVGDTVTLPLSSGVKSDVKVVAPSGVELTPRLLAQRGQIHLHLDEVVEAGVYRVNGTGKDNVVFCVNAPRTDSALGPMDAKALEEWWRPASFEVVSAESASQQLREQSSHWPLWPALIVLAGLLLLAETVYVHRLCPRADPKTADAVVPQRGVLRPVGKQAI